MLCSFQFDSSTAVYHASSFDCSDYCLAWFYDEYVSMLILRTVNSVQSRRLCFLKTRQPFICSEHVYCSTAMSHPACYHSKRIQIKIEISITERNNATHLALVVQTLDSAIHRINHYPPDKYLGNQLHYPLDRDLSIR